MKRACLWHFALRGAGLRLYGGFGATCFEARAEAAVFWGVEPAELVPLAFDSRVTR